ncbi:MAG TPA: ATP-binding protein [Bryobacteraceae bacterium]|jgi:PAS domain S-box-containing protein
MNETDPYKNPANCLHDKSKILVVEDEQVVAMDVEAHLLTLGYEVVGLAGTGEEALSLTDKMCPDLVLMDIQLHGELDGIAVADQIRQRWRIPVVFMTAFAGEETLARAREAGPYGYITKPFKTQDLQATVAVALQQYRNTREIFQEHGWLRTLLAGMRDGVIATDIDGRVKYLNPAAEELTGWALADAIGRQIEEVYPLRAEDGLPLERCQLRRVLATNKPVARQRFLLGNTGNVMVEDSAAPIHNAEGQLSGAVTVIVDITERQKLEQERARLFDELERTNAELARFSHTVAHDLRAPARTVKLFTELLARDLGNRVEKSTGEHLRVIGDAASGMERLIETLLRYAELGAAPIERQRVSASDVLAEVRVLLSALLSETRAQIEAGDLPMISADPVQFQQLLLNLLVNAVQYRLPDQAPQISIRGEATENGCEFAVTDHGQGIPAEQQKRVFAPFTRLHGGDVPGTGLGLALCRTIVERNGGRIWAESAGAGQGTTIRFFLPCASPAPPHE